MKESVCVGNREREREREREDISNGRCKKLSYVRARERGRVILRVK